MAKYDHGGGCPCGLYAECDPRCRSYKPPKETQVRHTDTTEQAGSSALKEIAGRVQKLAYREMVALTKALNDHTYHKVGETGQVLSADGILEAMHEVAK